MIRFAIYRKDAMGLTLASPNQGRHFYDSEQEAENALVELRPSLEAKLGYEGLCVRAVDCYENGDAKGIYA